MRKQEFTGKNIDEALDLASECFKTEKSLIHYKVIPQSSGSIFTKLFSRGIKIEAWVESTTTDLQAAAREAVMEAIGKSPQPQQPPSSGIKSVRKTLNMHSPGVESLFKEYTSHFMKSFDINSKQFEVEIRSDGANIHIKDEYVENLLARSDRLSLAFEHVFKRIAQKKIGDIASRISLNAGNALDKREDNLIEMAKSLAEKVLKTGKSVILSSKSSQERKIIHLALDGYKGILTKSIGTGAKRKLIIYTSPSSPSATAKSSSPSPQTKGDHPPARWKRRKKRNTSAKKESTALKQDS
ncbi:MAG: Jag N-terminal domain-containing protein [Silvanigrellaceae bacterium]|nr:Jag N-terminal domain-containing protein [Silvanigrellaceae bacterium]